MATKTTIEMAREAAGDDWGLFQEYMPEIHRLVELVRADERARMAEQPAQRTWVGLTDEEMNAALDYWSEDERSAYGGAHEANCEYVSMIDTWRYIEAKLKEKNNG